MLLKYKTFKYFFLNLNGCENCAKEDEICNSSTRCCDGLDCDPGKDGAPDRCLKKS